MTNMSAQQLPAVSRGNFVPVARSFRPSNSGAGIRISQDALTGAINLIGVKEVAVESAEAAMNLLQAGSLIRATSQYPLVSPLHTITDRSHRSEFG